MNWNIRQLKLPAQIAVTHVGKQTRGYRSFPRGDDNRYFVSLNELKESVTAPDDLFKRGLYRFTDHPTGHSVLPTAATCTLVGFQHRGVPLLISDTPVSLGTSGGGRNRRALRR